MPIGTITQDVSTIPAPPHRGVDVQTQFVIKQEDFQDHLQGTTVTELNTLKDQLNTRIGEINSTVTTMNGYADTASAGASTATSKAGEASTSASGALTSRNQAETFKNNASTFATSSSNSATIASQWADNNYNVAVETGKYSAKHWSVVAQNATVNKVTKVTSTANAIVRFNGTTGDVQNSGVIVDDNGNVGIGVTPSAWGSSIRAIEQGNRTALFELSGDTILNNNAYHTGTGWIRKTANACSMYETINGAHYWSAAPSGTAGNLIAWTNTMALGSDGSLNVGVSGSAYHNFRKNVTLNAGNPIFEIAESGSGNGWSALIVYGVGAFSANSSNCAVRIGKDAITGRSINAGGTINASGADYAEYEYSNDITLVKGQIVGFKADGTLTDMYNESVRFAIKSTNPSIVGGDTWGIEDIVGKRPEQPVRKLDKTEQVKIEDSEEFETVVIEAGDTDAEWESIEAQYKIDLADFEARLEAERQKVDRIAYAGKVPVNVYGAIAGQYIVAIEKDGGIDGLAVNKADMTFAQYQDTVGRVNKILDDGRAEVAVIIH